MTREIKDIFCRTFALAFALTTTMPAAQGIPFLNPPVTTEYDHSVQFSGRTYSWGDARMPVATYVEPMKALVDKNLKARGWQLVPAGGNATVFALGDTQDGPHLIAYYADHGGMWTQNWSLQGLGNGWKPGYGEPTFNALGTAETHLVVDIFDTGSHHLIFRGVVGQDLSNGEKKNIKKLASNLKQMLKQLPKK